MQRELHARGSLGGGVRSPELQRRWPVHRRRACASPRAALSRTASADKVVAVALGEELLFRRLLAGCASASMSVGRALVDMTAAASSVRPFGAGHCVRERHARVGDGRRASNSVAHPITAHTLHLPRLTELLPGSTVVFAGSRRRPCAAGGTRAPIARRQSRSAAFDIGSQSLRHGRGQVLQQSLGGAAIARGSRLFPPSTAA